MIDYYSCVIKHTKNTFQNKIKQVNRLTMDQLLNVRFVILMKYTKYHRRPWTADQA